MFRGSIGMQVQEIARRDLPQPGILRTPGVVHERRSLRHCRQGEVDGRGLRAFEGFVPDWQRIEIGGDALAVFIRWLSWAVAKRSQAEFLQGFRIQLQRHRIGVGNEAHAHRPVQVIAIGHLVVTPRVRHFRAPESTVGDVALQLVGIGRALAVLVAFGAAPAGQQADAGCAFVAHDVIGIVAVARAAIGLAHRRQSDPRTEFEQHRLEAAHVASVAGGIRFQHRVPYRIRRAIGVRDRPVEQRHGIEAFQVGRVRQDQVRVGDHLAGIRVGIDDAGNAVLAIVALVGEPVHRLARVHRRVPAHVGHEQEQQVHRLRIAGPGIADDGVQHAVHGQRIRPRKRVVDAPGLAVFVHQQIFRPVDESQRRRIQATVGVTRLARPVGRRNRPRKWRLVTETSRCIHRAQQQLQQVQCAAGVEAIAVRRDTAHRVHRHRAACHLRMLAAVGVGPLDRQHQRIVEGGFGKLPCNATNGVGGDAAARCHGVRRILRIEIALGDQMEGRTRLASVG